MGLVVPNIDSSRELRFDVRHTGDCKQPCLGNPTVKLCHSVQTGDFLSSRFGTVRSRSNRVSRVGWICPLLQLASPRALFFACAAKKGSVLDVRQSSIDSAAADSHPRAQGKVCPRGTLLAHRGYVVQFAHAAGDEFSAALVLLRWQSALALDAGHYRSGDRPFLRGHLCDAGLAGAPNWTRPSISLFFLGVWIVHRELRWNTLHGGNNCLEARLLALRRRENCHRFRLRWHRRRSVCLRGRYRRFRANRARGRRAPRE